MLTRLVALLLFCLSGVALAGPPERIKEAPQPGIREQIADLEKQVAALAAKIDALKKSLPPAAPPAAAKAAPAGKPDPVAATAQLHIPMGGGFWHSCTCTVVGPRRPDGRWDVLGAGHCCTRGVGDEAVLTLRDGREVRAKVAAVTDLPPDLCWLVTDRDDLDLPFAVLAEKDAPPGTKVWQDGYGPARAPGPVRGEVVKGPVDGQMHVDMIFAPGDSGGGIFDARTGELVAVVSRSFPLPTPAGPRETYWGGAASVARSTRPKTPEVP